MNSLDARFKYVPAAATNVMETWKRFGFKPTHEKSVARRSPGKPLIQEPSMPSHSNLIRLFQ
jgi:hypothetical protein